MNIVINGQAQQLPPGSTLADAIALLAPSAPYAAAVNREFVPRTAHATHLLNAGDQVEIIRPVTGG